MTCCSQTSSAERALFPLLQLSFSYWHVRGLFVHPVFTLKHSYFYFYYHIDENQWTKNMAARNTYVRDTWIQGKVHQILPLQCL